MPAEAGVGAGVLALAAAGARVLTIRSVTSMSLPAGVWTLFVPPDLLFFFGKVADAAGVSVHPTKTSSGLGLDRRDLG